MNDTTTAIARMKATIPSANVERVVFWIMRPAARVLRGGFVPRKTFWSAKASVDCAM